MRAHVPVSQTPTCSADEERQALDLDPSFDLARGTLATIFLMQNRLSDAEREMRKLALPADDPALIAALAQIAARRGDTRGALDAIARLKAASPGRYVSPMLFAWIYLALNDDAEALVRLKKAVAEHDSALTSLKVNPTYDRVRQRPEFVEVLQRVGLG